MNIFELKQKFAKEWHKTPKNPYDAAVRACGPGRLAAQVAVEWTDDPEVLGEVEKLKKNPVASEGMAKKDVLGAIWELGCDPGIEPKDRINALKLYAEVAGLIIKNEKIEQVSTNKVMLVKDHDDWESKAEEQQRKLVSNG